MKKSVATISILAAVIGGMVTGNIAKRWANEMITKGHTSFTNEIYKTLPKAQELEDEYRYQDALNILDDALRLIDNAMLNPEEKELLSATIYSRYGRIHHKKYNYKTAEIFHNKSLNILRRDWRPRLRQIANKQIAVTLLNLSDLYISLAKFNEAENSLSEALSINKRFGERDSDITIRINANLATIYFLKGDMNQAKEKELTSLKIAKDIYGKESKQYSALLNNFAVMYADRGFSEDSIRLLNQDLDIGQKVFGNDHPEVLIAKHNLANSFFHIGKDNDAETILQEILEDLENKFLPTNDIKARTLALLGAIYRDRDLYSQSEEFYLQALDLIKSQSNSVIRIKILPDLAHLYFLQGRFKEAEELSRIALEKTHKKLGLAHPNSSKTLNFLAHILNLQNKNKDAQDLLLRALEITESNFGVNHPQTLSSYAFLANFYDTQGLLKKGEELNLKVLAQLDNSQQDSSLFIAPVMNNLGFNYLAQQNYIKSELYLTNAFDSLKEILGVDNRKTLNTLNNLSLLYQALNKKKIANQFAEDSLRGTFKLLQRETQSLLLSNRQFFSRSLADGYLSVFNWAFDSELDAKTALLSRLNFQGLLQLIERQQSQISNLSKSQLLILDQIQELTQTIAHKGLNVDFVKRLRLRKDKLEKELLKSMPNLNIPFVEINQITASLPVDSVLIEFQKYEPLNLDKLLPNTKAAEKYMAFILKPSGQIDVVDLGSADVIDNKIQEALFETQQGYDSVNARWKEVRKIVLNPLAAATVGSKQLFISPDAELHRVPFALLRDKNTNKILGDAIEFHLLTSGRELLGLTKKMELKSERLLVVANPDFNSTDRAIENTKTESETKTSNNTNRSRNSKEQLWTVRPYTAIEGREIAQLINAQLLMGDDATALAIQQEVKPPKLLHIASHSYYEAPSENLNVNPLIRSGIVLAGANHPDSNSKDDGLLTALEVSTLNWEGTELVVVSGCASGKGDIQSGEGVYGLKRAIAVAGSKSSLLSLWDVDDEATAVFMKTFYQKLKDGERKDFALASTQEEFRSGLITSPNSQKDWSKPFYWAAFQLSGDWQPIDW